MIYLQSFDLMSRAGEESFLNGLHRTCFDSYYPLRVFPQKGLEHIDFADITIFSGGNGSGKSTLLNIIAEKLGLQRSTCFNKTYFFDPYMKGCDYEWAPSQPEQVRSLLGVSRIITSDEVFDHIIDVRHKNEYLGFKRDVILEEKGMMSRYGCQFILSSHSPFILSLPDARIYNMDATPVETCRWTDLPNIRLYHDFFQQHQTEFGSDTPSTSRLFLQA